MNELKLYEFQARQTGTNCFYVMSDSLENAIKSLEKLKENDFIKGNHTHEIFIHEKDEPASLETC